MSRSERRQRAAVLALALGVLAASGAQAHASPRQTQIEDRASVAEFLRAWGGVFPFVRAFLRPSKGWEKNGGSLDPWGQPSQAQPTPPTATTSVAPPDGGR